MRRSWPPVICSRTPAPTASAGVEPGEVERLLGRLAVAVDGHDVGQADGVVARVVEARAVGVGEVLDDGERRRVGREPRQGERAEVLLEVAQQGVADALAEQHAAADDHPADRPVGGDAQQQPDLGDPAQPVDAHRARRRRRRAARCARTSSRVSGDSQPTSVSVGASMSLTASSLARRVSSRRRPRRDRATAEGHEAAHGLDGSFLYMETPTTFGHVSGLGIYERPSADFDPYDAVYERWGSFVGQLEPMRRRIVEVPLRPRPPVLGVRPQLRPRLPHPPPQPRPARAGGSARRAGLADRRAADGPQPAAVGGLRHRGPGERRWALLTKYHHATIDGASGVMMMNLMHDTTPDAEPPGENLPWEPEELPSRRRAAAADLANLVRNPAKAARTQLRLVREFAESAGLTSVGAVARQAGSAIRTVVAPGDGPRVNLPLTAAPPTPWNRSITAHRRFAMRSASLDNIKRLKEATGGTVNDVVMAICAGALREYLIEHDALPDRRCGRWCRCRSAPARRRTPGPTGCPGSSSTCRPTSPTRWSGSPAAARRCWTAKQQFELVPAEALDRHPAVRPAGRGDVGDPPGGAPAAGGPGRPRRQRHHLQRARARASRCTSPAPSSTSTSRCRRSARAWASTSPCTATSTS